MENLYKDGQTTVPVDMSNPQTSVTSSGAGNGKPDKGMTQMITAETWNINSSGLMKKPLSPMVAVPANSLVSPVTDSQGSVALKVAATVLQPICLGDSPVVLPIHLQMAGGSAPQVSPAGSTPYLMTNQGPMTLPLVLEQQVFQHLNSPVLQQGTTCPSISLQNNMLCQNTSLSFSQSPPLDQKLSGQTLESGILPLLQSPGFAAALQDLFPSQSGVNSSSCHSAASAQPDGFSSAAFPPLPFSHPYTSLSPLVPPATLLVPYPVIVPLPVPLPIPIPIPIPVPQNEDFKGATDPPKPPCTFNKSTQTNTKETLNLTRSHSRDMTSDNPQVAHSCFPLDCMGEVLDLSVKGSPIQTKQEDLFQQDNVLDLSVASVRKPCIQTHVNKEPGGDHTRAGHSCEDKTGSALSLQVLHPMECTQNLDSKILKGLASLEFSRQHKWVVDSSNGRSECESKCSSGNIEILSTSQTAKVIVSVKDAVPAIFCGKLKGLSGVSTKNFSIKRDANQEAMLQQQYSIKAHVEPRDPNDALKKTPKSKPIKLKKVSSQEIHILPIKKQRLAAFFPRK